MRSKARFWRTALIGVGVALSALANGQTLSRFVFAWENDEPDHIAGGKSALGLVELDAPAPVGGVWVSLSSNQPYLKVWGPKVFVPAGQTKSNTFTLSTIPPHLGAARLTASVGSSSIAQTVSVDQPVASVVFPNGQAPPGLAITETVTLPCRSSTPTVVNLSSSLAGVTTPSTVTIQAGALNAVVSVQTAATLGDGAVTLSAWVTGYAAARTSLYLSKTNPLAGLSFPAVASLAQNLDGIVETNSAANPPLTVSLLSSNAQAHVPPTVSIPNKTAPGDFPLTWSGGVISVNTPVTITAQVAGYPPVRVTVTFVPGWMFQANGSLSSSIPVDANGVIYFTSGAGTLYAVQPNGTQKWSVNFSGNVSSPVLEGGVVYLTGGYPGSRSTLYAMNLDGSRKWFYNLPTGAGPQSLAVGTDGAAYVSAVDPNEPKQTLYAIGSTGRLKWQYVAGAQFVCGPAVAPGDGTVYVCLSNGDLDAVNPITGLLKWSTPLEPGGPPQPPAIATATELPNSAAGAPVVAADGTVFVPLSDGDLCAVNPQGKATWDFVSGLPSYFGPLDTLRLATDGSVYFSDDYGWLFARNSAGGKEWATRLGQITGAVTPLGVATTGRVYAGQGASLCALNHSLGTVEWTFTALNASGYDGPICGGVSFASDGTVYFGTSQGALYAVKWTPASAIP
jgi:outer membrane protein assembly factor BamB